MSAQVLFATDDFFAPAENLLKVLPVGVPAVGCWRAVAGCEWTAVDRRSGRVTGRVPGWLCEQPAAEALSSQDETQQMPRGPDVGLGGPLLFGVTELLTCGSSKVGQNPRGEGRGGWPAVLGKCFLPNESVGHFHCKRRDSADTWGSSVGTQDRPPARGRVLVGGVRGAHSQRSERDCAQGPCWGSTLSSP